jgi:Peptidase family S41
MTGLTIALALATAQAANAGSGEDWRKAARQDVEAAYALFVANHPGMHDPSNRAFPRQLKRAREAGLEEAKKASDFGGYRDALGAFSSILADGHALAAANPPAASDPAARQWPGFVAAWRGKGLWVHKASAGAPAPAGSAILACDGRKAEALVKARLLAANFRAREGGQWWSRAQQAFTASPTFMQLRPERCTFRTPAGRKVTAALSWTAAPADFTDLLTAASDGERTPIGLSEPRRGIFLVGLPDFQPDAASVQAYRRLYDELRARRGELLKARAIVLDLRHNNGGSSTWPKQAAQAIWGDEPVDSALARYFSRVRIWWRASEGNSAYLPKMAAGIRANGNVEVADSMEAVGKGMRAALERGEPYYVQVLDRPEPTNLPPAAKSDLRVPVYVITPGRCASACLDAVDIFTRFGNVTLIGAPTSADSTYMEVRVEDLPSGKGRIVIPTKLWSGRPRAAGEYYRPAIEVGALDWSTATFLDRIEAQLGRR